MSNSTSQNAKVQGHTPGPWHRNIQPATKYPTVWAGRNKHVAYIKVGNDLSDAEAEGNISLISAAPELLEACELAIGLLCTDGALYEPTLKMMRAAIAKARGQQ